MCNCDIDGDGPSVFNQQQRRARKTHQCCECRGVIPAGALYEYTSGVWDGCGASFKTCLGCVVLRAAHIEAEERGQEEDRQTGPVAQRNWPILGCAPTIGSIISSIGECAREDPRYVRFFREARRELLAKASAPVAS